MSSASAPLDAAIVARVQASFARQGAMATLGAELAEVAAGRVAIALPIEPRLSQQDGFLHAGVVVTALDSACGYAALTLMPDDETPTASSSSSAGSHFSPVHFLDGHRVELIERG